MTSITDEHIAHWREHGYVVLQLLDPVELENIRNNIARYMPTWDEYEESPYRYRSLINSRGQVDVHFPFVDDPLNDFSVRSELVALAKHLLRTEDVALSHSQLVGKYAGAGDYEQQLHCDYGNNTLAYPKDDQQIFDLPTITYYSDVTLDLGPTYILPKEHACDPLWCARVLSRYEHADMYSKEVPVTVPAGSTLVYSMRTYHRGSAMLAQQGARFSHHIGWRNGSYRWAGQRTFQHEGGRPEMDHFLQRATPEQRSYIGFPPVGDPYWDCQTLAGIAARYPAMDLAPYRDI